MKFVIKHEMKGRIRLHMAQRQMSIRQADLLQYYLTTLPQVKAAKVYERTCDAVVRYEGSRKNLLEEIASQPVLYQTSGLSELGRQPTLHDIFSAAGLGDKLARAVVRYAARWFAVSLRQLLFLADPDIIIIQGDYAPAGQYFLDTLRQYVQSYVAPAVDVIPDIRLSRLGETASCLLGGALIGRGAVFEDDSLYE